MVALWQQSIMTVTEAVAGNRFSQACSWSSVITPAVLTSTGTRASSRPSASSRPRSFVYVPWPA